MGIKELKDALEAAGVEYNKTAKLAELQSLYDQHIAKKEGESGSKDSLIELLSMIDVAQLKLFLSLKEIQFDADDQDGIIALVAAEPLEEFTMFIVDALNDVIRISRDLEVELAKDNKERTQESFDQLLTEVGDDHIRSFLLLKHVDDVEELSSEKLRELASGYPFIEFVSFLAATLDHPIATSKTHLSSDNEALPKARKSFEFKKTEEGLNIIFAKTIAMPGIKSTTRFRAGIEITALRTRYEVDDDALNILLSDQSILIEDK